MFRVSPYDSVNEEEKLATRFLKFGLYGITARKANLLVNGMSLVEALRPRRIIG